MHGRHADIADEGLAEGCAGCIEVAENPVRDLDANNLRALVARLLSDRFDAQADGEARQHARSEPEAIAMAQVMTLLEKFGHLIDIAPREVEWYLRERWRVDITVRGTAHESAVRELRARGMNV